jgi:hypothetical protein
MFRLENKIKVFEFKKLEKCKINKRKISPTPKSITQRNPIKISPFEIRAKKPINIKYNPPKYHDINKEW